MNTVTSLNMLCRCRGTFISRAAKTCCEEEGRRDKEQLLVHFADPSFEGKL